MQGAGNAKRECYFFAFFVCASCRGDMVWEGLAIWAYDKICLKVNTAQMAHVESQTSRFEKGVLVEVAWYIKYF